jgi:hypothetical protein
MAINERLIDTQAAASALDDNNLILELDAGDVDSYDGDGDVWYDIHDFEFTPTTNVSEHFNTVLFQSNNQVAQPITQVGFKPDLILGKTRQDAASWDVIDSVRGGDKFLSTDRNYAQSTGSYITSFDIDGFTLGTEANFNYFDNRQSVAFCFKAGGAASLNEEGTIDSQVSVNNDLGFSIATYTGVGYPASSNAEIGHGLDSAPELVIIKGIGGTGQSGGAGYWVAGSSLLGSGWDGSMYLNSNTAYYTAVNYFWNGAATSSVIKLKTDWFVNGVNNNYVAYSFVSKTGVSKVGTYTGNGNATGPIVTLGFEPAFVMIKGVDITSNWTILDNKRDTSNPNSARLDADSSMAEYSAVGLMDFNSDGFQIVTTQAAQNGNGNEFIYYAIANT